MSGRTQRMRMTYLLQIAIVLTGLSNAIAAQAPAQGDTALAPPATEAFVEQPRPFGYVVGDLLTQRVLLHANGVSFEPAELPASRRMGAWFERRASKIESTSDGRRWLVVPYQIINAPQALTTVSLPAWQLESTSGQGKLTVPAWPISIAPLTPQTAFTSGNLSELRPDHPAPTIATAPIRRQVFAWSSALAITLLAWIAWLKWRNGRAATNQPFARALHEIRRLDPSAPQAWQALHRAFDRTANRVVQPETLPALFRHAPHLAPLRADIERFFAQSSDRFFGSGLSETSLSVRTLCTELRRLEKQHEP